jgi:hypothetical protein
MLSPGGKLVVYGGVSLKPLELMSLALIGKRLSVAAYFQPYPDLQPKSDASRKRLAKYLGRNGPTQLVEVIMTNALMRRLLATVLLTISMQTAFAGDASRNLTGRQGTQSDYPGPTGGELRQRDGGG